MTPCIMFSVCVYVLLYFVCLMYGIRSIQLLVHLCYFGYPLYFVRSTLDSCLDGSTLLLLVVSSLSVAVHAQTSYGPE
jgi:hypothetical protein